MLHLFFSVGDQQYALRTDRVRRIVPNVRLRPLPDGPPWISGLLNYHESVVPVIDVSTLMAGRRAADSMDTRIILIDRSESGSRDEGSGDGGSGGLVGLLAEKVLEVHAISEDEVRASGVRATGASNSGRVVIHHGELIHLVDLEDLLSGEQRRDLLLQLPGGAP